MSADEPAIDAEHVTMSTEGCSMTRDVERVPHEASSRVSSHIQPRVLHIDGSRNGRARVAYILTAPLGRGSEIRCCIRHPDGYLVQVGQATDLVEGGLAQRPATGREATRADGR